MVPEVFGSGGLRCFSALVDVHDLAIIRPNLPKFTSGLESYFCHFSLIPRSIALLGSRGSPRQLLDFLSLFQKLDDIKIVYYLA